MADPEGWEAYLERQALKSAAERRRRSNSEPVPQPLEKQAKHQRVLAITLPIVILPLLILSVIMSEETGIDKFAPAFYVIITSIALLGMVIAVRNIPRTKEGHFRGCGCTAFLVAIIGIMVFFGWAATLIYLIFSITGV